MWLEVVVFIIIIVGTILLTAALCSAMFKRRFDRLRALKEELIRSREDFRLQYLAQAKEYELLQQRYKHLESDLERHAESISLQASHTRIVEAPPGLADDMDSVAELKQQVLDAQSRCKQCESEKKLLLSALEDLQEQLSQGAASSGPASSTELKLKSQDTLSLASAKNVSKSVDNKEEIFARIKDNASQIDFLRIGSASSLDKEDLQQIKGIGPYIEKKLNSAGIYCFRQIANFSVEDEKLVNEVIEFFPGRIHRDEWVAQAKRLLNTERQPV